MSLPWFPFDADAYTGDTMHLTTEEHGAYLLLMLAYYRSEKPLPCSDRQLAAVTKLTMERWLECKPTLAAYFEEKDGFWHHDYICRQISDRAERHSVAVLRTEAARKAKADKAAATEQSPELSQTKRQKKSLLQNASASVTGLSTELLQAPQLQEQEHRQIREGSRDDPPDLKSVRSSRPVPDGFQPDERAVERCHSEGATDAEIDDEVRKFINWNRAEGTESRDWQATFQKWWDKWKPHREGKAAPRVELSMQRPLSMSGYQPSETEWNNAAALWAKSESKWSSQLGPDPHSRACRCPPEILRKHGINPATGLKLEKAS